MNPEYARVYRQLYERHWWWRAREAWLASRLLAWIGASEQRGSDRRRVLDVGCGDRLAFGLLSRWGEVYGVESDRSLLSLESLADPRLYVGEFGPDLPFPGPFDLITAMDVIEHIPDERPALKQMAGLLSDGGLLFINVPARMSLWTRHDEVNRHYRRYSQQELGARLAEAGLEVLESVGCFWFTVPLKWIQARLERHWIQSEESPTLPRVPATAINRTLILLCRLEQLVYLIFRSGFGSSLFVVARKSPAGPELKPQ